MKTITINKAMEQFTKNQLSAMCEVSTGAITKAQRLNAENGRNYRIELGEGGLPVALGENRGWVRVVGNPRKKK